MKFQNILFWAVIALSLMTGNAYATRHIIQFGGSFGLKYVPDSIEVQVGDTIQWQGNFTMHPLSSTSVPPGAASFTQSSSDVFNYVVTIEGTYLYQCNIHFSLGMVGKFIATALTGVGHGANKALPAAFRLHQNFPNPFNPTTNISFDVPYTAFVSLKIYNLIGEEVADIAKENMAAGSYSRIWDATSMPSGVYFYRLSAGQFTDTKKLILIK
jgi:plastocyanin